MSLPHTLLFPQDVVIRGGENIATVEVSDRIYRMDEKSIVEVACFGVSHPRFGEELCAAVCVVSSNGTGTGTGDVDVDADSAGRITPDAVKQYVAQHLASFKVPSRVFVRSQLLPRGPTGKILKKALREEYSDTAAAAA